MTAPAGTREDAASTGPAPAPRAGDARVDALLQLVQEQLGMDAAFVNQFVGDTGHFRNVTSVEPIALRAGSTAPREASYCQLIVDGEIDGVLPDVAHHRLVRSAPSTQDLGIAAFIGVPVTRRDGSLYGTLCVYAHSARPELGERDETVLRAAARMLSVVVEEEEADERRRAGQLARLDTLLASGGPDLVFQPLTELSTGVTVGFEALSRFAEGTPDAWFDMARSIGATSRLELAALDQAVLALGSAPGYVAVNISAATVMAPGFEDHVGHLPLERLVLEITEHEPVEDYDALTRSLRGLRDRGLRLAIDDAGAGFASMRHVIALEPDIIKLDISLVRGIDDHLGRQAFAAAMAAFASKIEATTVAEGIETAAELAALRDIGVELGQGFHLARPAPVPTPVAARPGLFDGVRSTGV
ncbi:sensor domain-containing phosphodiesterase [Solicola sp. PLA-1-18]|uniref:sensor domain-containing phosphodiesterase n=1 Tax=Solicola sp. PLA-1-18 TaxID=3380532 RepID=UPI003B7BAFD4